MRSMIDDNFDIVLICWNELQQSNIHDHPEYCCCFKLLEGSLFEDNYIYHQNNLIFTTPFVLSADPRISLVKTDIVMSESNTSILPSIQKDFKVTVGGTELGQLMNVYLNMAFIDKKITENKDENNNVSLFTLLQSLCEGINSSLGSINKISPVIDEEDLKDVINERIKELDTVPNDD